MHLSLVIPCFNESDSIEQMREQLNAIRSELARRGPFELVLVDDGSTDDTYERLKSAFADWEQVQIVRHERNRGLGAALRTGFAHARGEVIVVTDSDGTYPFTTIPDMLDMLTPDVDIVTSSAYHPQGGVEGVPAYRLLFSQGASLIYRTLVNRHIHTYTAMYRAYRRRVVEAVPPTLEGYVVMAEILVNALLAGYRVAEYPAVLHVRKFGQSKAKIWRITRSHLRFQAHILWRRLMGLFRATSVTPGKAGRL
ncbi:MAG: glycosyltransferase family 2 protein [Roseiflexus castenholzii]|uniref:glycosyltransferase family 2 protein n=1 Tax=Roseiflexus castenholzii TaxID=120962 RepID=UPI000CACDB26|nr:MAG: glycosyltransferase family 2 protein [Roseiflexus castenholzii]